MADFNDLDLNRPSPSFEPEPRDRRVWFVIGGLVVFAAIVAGLVWWAKRPPLVEKPAAVGGEGATGQTNPSVVAKKPSVWGAAPGACQTT
jgi:hypothetical protein